ncbi:uncharacterized protein LOC112458150 [Temnothorax curvispinosus]|uniref:Uncharacterized protein LOC112458150 n=1 Tax=Temnothorax curvispinosus TaxID=300111 RepID=A0A6J1Q590_9HYME|nr:uncharacterized protein LOC112458150 [Temnothorax curvispinosus]
MASVAKSSLTVLLSTVQAEVLDVHGNLFPVRILLDSASQLNFISENCMKKGGFKRTKCRTVVLAVSDTKAAATRGSTSLVIQVQGNGNTRVPIEATILPRISAQLPSRQVEQRAWKHIEGLKLADPQYHRPGPVDLLIGADIFASLIRDGRRLGRKEDIGSLRRNQSCSRPLRKLAPFLDGRGVLRVGGRLTHSAISYKVKHPALLFNRHRLTELIAERTHRLHLYPGRRASHYILAQNFWILVEAILNSRPLCPTSSDSSDLGVLSPGYFLTLESFMAVPHPDLNPVPKNRLDRWQMVQHMHQQFWRRWHDEYLHTLQQRPKWLQSAPTVKKDTLVLVKGENAPPLQWRQGRIVELHPGRDGVARVATVQTADGVLTRPLAKLCPLPMDTSPEESVQA